MACAKLSPSPPHFISSASQKLKKRQQRITIPCIHGSEVQVYSVSRDRERARLIEAEPHHKSDQRCCDICNHAFRLFGSAFAIECRSVRLCDDGCVTGLPVRVVWSIESTRKTAEALRTPLLVQQDIHLWLCFTSTHTVYSVQASTKIHSIKNAIVYKLIDVPSVDITHIESSSSSYSSGSFQLQNLCNVSLNTSRLTGFSITAENRAVSEAAFKYDVTATIGVEVLALLVE